VKLNLGGGRKTWDGPGKLTSRDREQPVTIATTTSTTPLLAPTTRARRGMT
jgi:hypothetical protein